MFRATRSCVKCLETSLSTLRATAKTSFDKLLAIELRKQRVGDDLDKIEADFGRTLAELRALVRTPGQLRDICGKIESWSLSGGQDGLFHGTLERQAAFLRREVEQVDAMLSTFISETERAMKRCDDVSQRELLDAQRINTYWTSAPLFRNLILISLERQ
jgi:hypothetical protein